MNTKHTATFQGHTFKRVSQNRVYTHMVVGLINIAKDRAETEIAAREMYAVNLEYVTQLAAGGTYHGTFANGAPYSRPITDQERDAARVTIAGGPDAEAADSLREFDARTAQARKTEDGLHTVYSAGWTSRPDLAVKLASKTPGGVIVEAVRT